MQQWEYKIFKDGLNLYERDMNRLGADGWELASHAMTVDGNNNFREHVLIFKRPKA